MDWFDLGDVEGRMHAKSGRQNKYQCFGDENQVNLMCSNITEGQCLLLRAASHIFCPKIFE